MKKSIILLLALLMTICLTALADTPAPADPANAEAAEWTQADKSFASVNVKLNTKSTTITMAKKVTYQLKAKLSGGTSSITWTSNNPAVATVNKSGLVTGKKAGTASIFATLPNGKYASCKVTVKMPTASINSLSSPKGGQVKASVKSGYSMKAYQLAYRKKGSSSWKQVTISKSGKSATKVISSLSGGNVYEFRVRGQFVGSNRKTYTTDWSKTKSVTVKQTVVVTPTPVPTPVPTPEPTPVPTPEPTPVPTPEPTAVPTPEPTAVPTPEPTAEPTPIPTSEVVIIQGSGSATVLVGEGEEYGLLIQPKFNGLHQIYSVTESDTIGYLYDSDMNQIAYNDDDGEGRNFLIEQDLEAGVTYQLNVKFYYPTETGPMTIRVEGPAEPAPTPEPGQPGTSYRAYIVGMEHTDFGNRIDYAPRNRGDAYGMKALLERVQDPYAITMQLDLTKSEILSGIRTAFAGADDDDVSLFFFAGHGASSGSLGAYDTNISTSELFNALNAVPGRVILILGSCYSGQAISAGTRDFNSSIIRTFSGKTIPDKWSGAQSKAGEFCTSKFLVLTASAYDEMSWGYSAYNIMPYHFMRGAGWTMSRTIGSGSRNAAYADTNGDKVLTLHEAFTYTYNETTAEFPMYQDGQEYYQNVRCYPSNCTEALFHLN